MFKKLLGPLIILTAVFVVVLLIQSKPRPQQKANTPNVALKVLTETLDSESIPLQLETEGFVSSRWQTTLTAELSGRVININDEFLMGNSFQEGDVLMSIDPLPYQAQLAAAESELRAAQARLIDEQKQALRAKNDWYRINPNKEPDAFNLRLPQLRAAEANLKAAEKNFELSSDNLIKTQIQAPYDGFLVSRGVDIGESIQTGNVLGEIVSRNELQVKASLSISDAELLINSPQHDVNLMDNSGHVWSAKNIRFEPFIDKNNRWRSIIIEIDDNLKKPLIGTFMNIKIILGNDDLLIMVPESSVSIDGKIWVVENGLTAYFKPIIKFQSNGYYYITPPNNTKQLEVIISPPNSITSGIKVETSQINQAQL